MKHLQNFLSISIIVIVVIGGGIFWYNLKYFQPDLDTLSVRSSDIIKPISPIATPFEPFVIRSAIAPPTPLPPIDPTLTPTPMVTRIPLAEPPFIVSEDSPIDDSPIDDSLTLLVDGDIVKVVQNNDLSKVQLTINIKERTGLLLGRRSNGFNYAPSPSPDGRRIIFMLTEFEKPPFPHFHNTGDAYLFDMETSQMDLLFKNVLKPTWSPDGRQIVYYHDFTKSLNVFNLIDGSTQEIMALERDPDYAFDWFTWSPDSTQIAFAQTWSNFAATGGIWVADSSGKIEPTLLAGMETYASNLAWSPEDSHQILYLSSREIISGETGRSLNLWTIHSENGTQKQLTQNMILGSEPMWSHDGQWILFRARNLLERDGKQYDLWLHSADGDVLKRITDNVDTEVYSQWTFTGNQIVFKVDEDIFELDLLTGTRRQILNQYPDFFVPLR